MVISHEHRFIFIKTKKTAGTSLEVLFSALCGPGDVLTPIIPPVDAHRPRNWEGFWNPLPELADRHWRGARTVLRRVLARERFYNHMSARLVRARVPRRVWSGYYKFCVERNPWDKTISHYFMRRHRAGGDLTLEQYFAAGDFCLNHPLYTDARGGLMVDEVIHFESLAEGLRGVLGRVGVPFDGTLPRVKTEHRPEAAPRLSAEQKEIVRRAFAREIELHGYREPAGAQR